VLLLSGSLSALHAQTPGYEEVLARSYTLYNTAQWKELLRYGRGALQDGNDFLLLRLRLGYAAFMLGRYSEALGHYQQVLNNDSYHETAHHFIRLCRMELGQAEVAHIHNRYLTKETLGNWKPVALQAAGVETSYKSTNVNERGNPLYVRAEATLRLGNRLQLRQAGATYRQQLSMAHLAAVKDNRNILIDQKEYYGQLVAAISPRLALKTSYHYLYTPFNNYQYNNHIGQLALRYYGNAWTAQLSGSEALITEQRVRQVDLQFNWYPLGNLDLYSMSTATWNSSGEGYFCGRQVLGGRVWKGLWLEGNVTLGNFRNLFENDALYVYHALDPNTQKMGLTTYYPLGGHAVLQAGYTFEERQLAGYPNVFFHQHSITGGFTWKF